MLSSGQSLRFGTLWVIGFNHGLSDKQIKGCFLKLGHTFVCHEILENVRFKVHCLSVGKLLLLAQAFSEESMLETLVCFDSLLRILLEHELYQVFGGLWHELEIAVVE